MTTTRQTFVTKVEARTAGAQLLPGVAAISTFVDQALPTFSAAAAKRGRAYEVELTITGDGGDEYALGSSWTDGFSRVLRVLRWDSNDTNERPIEINEDEYQIEENLPAAAASQIRFLSYSPSSSDRVVVRHTALHTVNDTSSTILAFDEEAFADLVASRVLSAAATSALSIVDQTVDTDVAALVDATSRSDGYSSKSRYLEQQYRDHFGRGDVEDGGESGGSFVVSFETDVKPTGTRQWRHTHSPRRF